MFQLHLLTQNPCSCSLAACKTSEKNAIDLVRFFLFFDLFFFTYAGILQLLPFQIIQGYERHIKTLAKFTREGRPTITMLPSRQ
jgi:hypothetical protein